MGAESSKLAWRPAAIAPREWLAWLILAAPVAAWTAAVVRLHFEPTAFHLGNNSRVVAVYGPPVFLAALAVFDERMASLRALRAAIAWSGLVLAAYIASHQLVTHDVALLAVPALLAAAVVVSRMPVLGVTVAFVISGAYGSLIAFWNFPEEQTVRLVIGALLVAVLWRTLVTGRAHALRLSAALALILVYFYATLVQTLLDHGNHAASHGFLFSAFYMLAAIVIAVAGWSPAIHERLAKALILVAALVGGYAVYRWIFGISTTEFTFYGHEGFNYVGGKLKLLGSFPSGQELGAWTALVIPFCFALAFTLRGPWQIVAIAAAALCAIALAGSELRIAVAAVAIGALVVVLLHEGARGFAGLRLGSTLTALLVMAAIGTAAYEIAGGTNDTISHSYSTLLHPTRRSDPSVSQRLYKWEAAVRDLRAHPFGYGIGTANANSNRFLPPQNIGAFNVDNGFLRVALEQGFGLMIVFGLMALLLAVDLARNSLVIPDRFSAGLAIGAAGTASAFFVLLWAGAFQDGPRALPVWIIAGLGLAQFTSSPRTRRT